MPNARRVLALLLAGAVLTSPAVAADGTLCGRPKASITDVLLDMQKPGAEAVYRDSRHFMFRDTTDSTVWVFTIKSTTAHPAMACSRMVTENGANRIETGLECQAGEVACRSFMDQATKLMDKHRTAP